MTADGDEHDADNDPLIRSMRSVWADMREEDPPSRGFSDLMAAARVKAVEMKPEPWWRRAFASLVRPPMLAATTVALLIGSTVALTRRAGTDAAAPVVESGLRERAEADKQVAGPRAPARDQFDDEQAEGKPAIASAGSGQVQRPAVRPRPAIINAQPHKDAAPAAEPPPVEAAKVATGDRGVVKGADEGPSGRAGSAPVGETQEEAPMATDSVTATRPPASPRPTTTDKPNSAQQLLKQAETAAGRKDCPAVRATVERLRRIDDKLYKDRAVTQPAIKRCL